jgi:hypothetical protein
MRITHESKRPLNADDLYEVTVTCNRVNLPQHPDWQPFVQQTLATSHIIALTDKKLASAELPKDGRALITVFSLAGNRPNRQKFINDTCSTNFLLSGRETLYLGATANRTEANAPGPVTSLIFRLIQVAVPVLPLFKASQVARTILGDVSQTEDPLKKLFSELDNGETITISEPLTQGKNLIETRYSRVTVSVDKIKSVIDIGALLQPFENSMKEAKANLNLDAAADDAVKQKCLAFANGLRDRNLSSRDISYGLVLIVELSGLNQTKTLSCMGKTYALPALEHKKLWGRWDGPTYTEAIAKTVFASDGPVLVQPKFEDIKQTLQFAVKTLGQYVQTRGTSGGGINNYVAEQVRVVNLADVFSPDITEATMIRSDLLGTLIARNFLRVGCMNSDTEALAMILAFKVKSDGQNKFADDDAIAVRIWIDGNKRSPK